MKQQQDNEPIQLAPAVRQHIDAWLQKFPHDQKQSAVIEALRSAQEHHGGWLSEPVMQAVAAYLQMPPIAVYEVASFYDQFETAPVGKHTIVFCTGVACMLRDVDEMVAYAQQKLGIKLGATTDDGMVTLKEVQCMAACDMAPMCQINQRHYHKNLDKKQIDALLQQLQADKEPVGLGVKHDD